MAVRRHLASALSERASERHPRMLAALFRLTNDRDAMVRQRASHALLTHQVLKRLRRDPTLRDTLRDRIEFGHYIALRILAGQGTTFQGVLIEAARHHDERTRVDAMQYLAALRTPEALAALEAARKDPSASVRAEAAKWLGQLREDQEPQ